MPGPCKCYWDRLEVERGKVVVKGTHADAATIARAFKAGFPFPELRLIYGVTDEDIRACLAWAEAGATHA